MSIRGVLIWCDEAGAHGPTECGEISRKWGTSPQTETHTPPRKCQHSSQQGAFKNVRGVNCVESTGYFSVIWRLKRFLRLLSMSSKEKMFS